MDQFVVVQTLGRGSFGVVRKVKRKVDERTLVAKEMDFSSANDKQKEQIVAEVRCRFHLTFPMVAIIDVGALKLHTPSTLANQSLVDITGLCTLHSY